MNLKTLSAELNDIIDLDIEPMNEKSTIGLFSNKIKQNPITFIETGKLKHALNKDDPELEKHFLLIKNLKNNNLMDNCFDNLMTIFQGNKKRRKFSKGFPAPLIRFFDEDINKETLLNDVKQYLKEQKGLVRKSNDLLLICDEIISNALTINSINPGNNPWISEKKTREFDNSKGCFFIFLSTDNIYIGCIDPHGEMKLQNSIKILAKSIDEGINANIEAGIGIGLRFIYDRCNALVINSSPRDGTLVFLTIPIHTDILDYKTIHFFGKE